MRKVVDRNDLAALFFELGYIVGAEIGVFFGIYSEELLKRNPNLFLYCIDPWEPYIERNDARKNQMVFRQAGRRLSKYNAKIIRKTSVEALKDFTDESLDFVYIDAIHDYKNARHDVFEWSKKVRIGGIVSGHDYCNLSHPAGYEFGIIQAVDEYVKANNQKLMVTKEKEFPSWFWIKR
jgi:predicted O-methyltransferase YrrM